MVAEAVRTRVAGVAGTADIAVAEVPAAHMRDFWAAAEEALPTSNSSIEPAAGEVAAAARKGWERELGRRS